MKLKGIFQVSEQKTKTGISWKLSGTKKTGERVRLFFQTEAEALGKKQELEIEGANVPISVAIKTTRLSNPQLADAEAAIATLSREVARIGSRSLTEVAQYFIAHYREPLRPCLLSAAITEFIASKQAAGRREDTTDRLETRLNQFLKVAGDKNVNDFQTGEIETYLNRPGLAPISRRNDRSDLHNFWGWCKTKGYASENILAAVTKIRLDEGEPEILPLPEVRALLYEAKHFKGGVLVPYVTLSLFCGLRPREISRIGWDNINFEQKTIRIAGQASKVRGRRLVTLSDNAVEWLRAHKLARTPLVGKNWRHKFEALRERIGYVSEGQREALEARGEDVTKLKIWIPDVLRHTALSNHFAYHKHEGQTAQWGGTSPVMIHKQYKGLVTEADAAEFWAIRPNDRKLVRLPKSKAA